MGHVGAVTALRAPSAIPGPRKLTAFEVLNGIKLEGPATGGGEKAMVPVAKNGTMVAGGPGIPGINFADGGTIHTIGNILLKGYAAVKGGAESLPAAQAGIEALKSFDLGGMFNAGKSLATTGLQWAGKSAGMAAAFSAICNGWQVLNHQKTLAAGGAAVVGDAIGGAAGGFGGAIAGGIGLAALAALGIAGAPLTIGAAIVGMLGYHFSDKAIRNTSIYRTIVHSTHDMLR